MQAQFASRQGWILGANENSPKTSLLQMLLHLAAALLGAGTVLAVGKEAAIPPPFFIQDPTDSLCLSGEEFKRCSLDTLFYVLGDPGESIELAQ